MVCQITLRRFPDPGGGRMAVESVAEWAWNTQQWQLTDHNAVAQNFAVIARSSALCEASHKAEHKTSPQTVCTAINNLQSGPTSIKL